MIFPPAAQSTRIARKKSPKKVLTPRDSPHRYPIMTGRFFSTIISTLTAATALAVCASCASQNCAAPQTQKHRKIAFHAYVFKDVATLEDVVKAAKQMGVDGVVCSQTIKLAKYPNTRFSPDMNAEQRAYVKKLFADAKLEIPSFGIGGDFKKPEDADKYLSFCREMGIPFFTWEGDYKNLPELDKKAAQYGVKVAVHHHTAEYNKQNLYNKPEGMLSRIKDFKNIFAIVDNGHWAREKTDITRGYKTLGKKIALLHFKDTAKFGAKEKTDVPLGTGCLDLPAMIATLDEIGFDGYFVLENETCFKNPYPAMRESVKYLRGH